MEANIERRRLIWSLAGSTAVGIVLGSAACAQGPRPYDMKVSREVCCTCCHAWTELMQKTGRFRVTLVEDEDMPALKRKLGVPSGLGACHTGVVEGYIIEGHVPADDILRLLETHPADVRGLAVPGMPRGSPGMEQPNGAHDPFEVLAFTASGKTSVFAHHA
jgi:hypothetical protein